MNAVVTNVPENVAHLHPEDVLTTSIDNLRDFVVELDKEKADKLRYKVEGDLVKIFITPYKTAINKNDFRFELGDYNIDTVITIEAASKTDLDSIVQDHAELMRDATIVSLDGKPGFDMSYGQAGVATVKAVLDIAEKLEVTTSKQAAEALLSSVILATDGFRNEYTTPEVMTTAATLISAGANQQEIMSQVFAPATVQEVSVEPEVVQAEPIEAVVDHSEEVAEVVEPGPELNIEQVEYAEEVAANAVAEAPVVLDSETAPLGTTEEVISSSPDEQIEALDQGDVEDQSLKLSTKEKVLPTLDEQEQEIVTEAPVAPEVAQAEVASDAPAEEIDLDAELTKTREAIKAATAGLQTQEQTAPAASVEELDTTSLQAQPENEQNSGDITITHDGQLIPPTDKQ